MKFFSDAYFNEVREVNEREKRKSSVILCGFECNNVNGLCDKFKVYQALKIGTIQLKGVVEIGESYFVVKFQMI